MISRVITCTIDPARVEEFRAALNTQIPRIQSQRGFVDNIESLDPATGQFCCMTLWESASDEANYGRGFSRKSQGK